MVMTLCCFCCRRTGRDSYFDEDSIGLLCDACHFDLVLLLRLVIDSAVALRRIDGKVVLKLTKALQRAGVR